MPLSYKHVAYEPFVEQLDLHLKQALYCSILHCEWQYLRSRNRLYEVFFLRAHFMRSTEGAKREPLKQVVRLLFLHLGANQMDCWQMRRFSQRGCSERGFWGTSLQSNPGNLLTVKIRDWRRWSEMWTSFFLILSANASIRWILVVSCVLARVYLDEYLTEINALGNFCLSAPPLCF